MTLAPATLVAEAAGEHATVRIGDGAVIATRVPRAGLPETGLELGLRPENVRVVAAGEGSDTTAKVELVERLGERTLIYGRLADGQPITAEDEGFSRVRIDDNVGLRIGGEAAHIFGPDGSGHHAEASA
jgi:multiple sugar transport system ATP-binding protein